MVSYATECETAESRDQWNAARFIGRFRIVIIPSGIARLSMPVRPSEENVK